MQVQSSPAATTGDQILRPKSGRKPLQPINTITTATPPKPKQQCVQELSFTEENNHLEVTAKTPINIEALDSSLAEELSAIRKRMERLKVDRERTEKMLKERDLALDVKMKELLQRGEVQKELEIEVDRLFRLKELKLRCMMVSPIKSLRERQPERKFIQAKSPLHFQQDIKEEEEEDMEESVGENMLESPRPVSSEIEQTSDSVSVTS